MDLVERFRLRNGLVVAQIAVCTVLLIVMSLFARSLSATRQIDIGMAPENRLLMAFDPSLDRRPADRSKQLLGQILQAVRPIPGVEAATLTSSVPLTAVMSNSNFVPAEGARNPQTPRVRSDIYLVGPEFFKTMGIPRIEGEDFGVEPSTVGRPAIVNEAFVRAAFPAGAAIGRRIVGDGKALDIVGVVATAKSRSVVEAPKPAIYLPILTEYSAAETVRGITLVVKTSGSPLASVSTVREGLHQVDRSLAVFDVRTMESHVNDAMIVPRLASTVSLVAGSVALAIAIIGVYGVVSFAVARRRRELGIRIAIGARPEAILTMVLSQGLRLGALGIGLGLAAAAATTRLAAALLYGVTPTDAATFAIVPLCVAVVALAASAFPARAAARLDPVEVLRIE